jgi:hypothetical protein
MAGPIERFLADDHRRLEALLDEALSLPGKIQRDSYAAFRRGLLKHIAMEERILLPAAQTVRGGKPLPLAARLRLDHAALAALLVPSPTPAIIAAIRAVLVAHNPIEEGPDGLYETCERLLSEQTEATLARLRAAPEVTVAPPVDGSKVLEATRRALERAGHHLDI